MSSLSFSFSYWKRYPFRVGTALVLAVALSVLNLSIPYAVDYYQLLSASNPIFALLVVVSPLALIPVFTYCRDMLWGYACALIMEEVAIDGFRHVQKLDYMWHTDHSSGAILKDINRGITAIESLSDRLLYTFIPIGLIGIGASIGMVYKTGLIGVSFIVLFGVFAIVSVIHSLMIVKPRYENAAALDSKFVGIMADSVSCNSIVRAFSAEETEVSHLSKHARTWVVTLRHAWNANIHNYTFQHIIMGLMLIVPLVILVYTGDTTSTAFVVTSWLVVKNHATSLGSEMRYLMKDFSDLRGLIAIHKTSPTVVDGPLQQRVGLGRIEFRNVSYTYNGRSPLFNDLSLVIEPGETVALVGATGSGKSTLMKLLMRLYDISGGEILIDGVNIRSLSQHCLRSSFAVVHQDPVLFHRTIRENIGYMGNDQLVETAAKMALAHDFIMSLPDGYDTIVGDRGVKLSGGERQRIAIARAICAERPILILDEATSALDTASERVVSDAMEHACVNRTSIIIAHRLSTVRRADRIVVFDNGSIVEMGTHDDLVRRGGKYAKLCEVELV